MRILGIETSCDETAAAIIEYNSKQAKAKILSNIVWSQIKEHASYGGIVPEVAARAHVEKLDQIICEALRAASASLSDIDAIAVTTGPGLIGGLMIGLVTAKALAMRYRLPLLPINHLEAHALTARLTHNVSYPYLLLLISGGHTQLLIIHSYGEYERLGTTIDDALGEAFDKTAKLLNLPYPGGIYIEKAALLGDPKSYALPKPLNQKDNFNFSFSGLKTAIKNLIEKEKAKYEQGILPDIIKNNICASFQQTICDILQHKIASAIHYCQREYKFSENNLVIAGGVAANKQIRATLENIALEYNYNFIAPNIKLCTDNAAMVAWAGIEQMLNSPPKSWDEHLDIAARARWPLDKNPLSCKQYGKKGAKA